MSASITRETIKKYYDFLCEFEGIPNSRLRKAKIERSEEFFEAVCSFCQGKHIDQKSLRRRIIESCPNISDYTVEDLLMNNYLLLALEWSLQILEAEKITDPKFELFKQKKVMKKRFHNCLASLRESTL